MCGRYAYLMTWDNIKNLIKILSGEDPILFKSYNVAPTQLAPVLLLNEESNLEARLLRWGLIPSWAKEVKGSVPLINARAETVISKPSFRSAFKSKRCLVPVSGYYEWLKSKDSEKKQAYYILAKDESPLFLAGLWESRMQEGKDPLETFTIITTEANKSLRGLHERMPVILKPDDIELWLGSSSRTDSVPTTSELTDLLLGLLKPAEEELLQFYPVNSLVNNPKNNTAECILKIQGAS